MYKSIINFIIGARGAHPPTVDSVNNIATVISKTIMAPYKFAA